MMRVQREADKRTNGPKQIHVHNQQQEQQQQQQQQQQVNNLDY
jgi:hypothetical protein